MNNGLAVMNGAPVVMHASDILTDANSAPIVRSVERRKFIPAPLLFAISTAFGISSTFQAYWMDALSRDHPMTHGVQHLLILNLVYWYIPALLAPMIMAFALRHPFDRKRWPLQALLHASAALAYSIVHTGVMMGVRIAILRNDALPKSFPGWWRTSLVNYLQQGISIALEGCEIERA